MALNSLLEEALRHVDGLRGFELLSSLSRLHRVQGGEELLVAAEHVAMALQEAGVEAELAQLRGPLGLWEHYGIWEPRGWRLLSASVERRRSDGTWETVASTSDTPLVAMVHSPPGSVEAAASYARPWRGRGGGVAVTAEPGWEGYYVLADSGYEAVIGFHMGPGVRYWGIYPPPFEEPPRVPAVSLPGEKALSLVGERVRVTVEAEYSIPVTPVLRARIGPAGAPRLVLVAHICHPRPGAHDNASGAAAAVEAMLALRAWTGVFEEKGVAVEALLVPEWTGTAAAITQGIASPEETVAALSVDMVAANLPATGGRLRLIATPPVAPSILDPVLDAALAQLDAESYGGATSYEWGSDHDVLLGHAVPASMLNEWPDRYYHTSMDTPDHISPTRLAATAAAVAAALRYLAEKPHAAAEAAVALHRALAARMVLNGGSPEAAAALHRQARDKAMEAAKALATGEAPQRPAPVVSRRPPYSRTYIYKLLRSEKLLHDPSLRESARTLATIAAASGSWDAAILYHRLALARDPGPEALEAAKKLAGTA